MAVRLSEALLTPKEQSPSLRSRDDIEHAVSPVAFPLLHHFEMKGRIGVGPRSSDVFLVANGNELRGLRGPGLFQKGPSKGNFNSICSLPLVLSCGTLEWVSTFKKPSIKDIHNIFWSLERYPLVQFNF